MRKSLIQPLFIGLLLALTTCGPNPDTSSDAGETAGTARWSAATERQLREVIDRRAAHGLDHVNFSVDGERGSAAGDAALTASALRYATALARGASDPAKLYDIYTLPRPDGDLEQGLANALANGKVADWIESLAPSDGAYRSLSRAYAALRRQSKTPATVIPPASRPLKPGEADPRLPAIARQLVASGYLDRAPASLDRYNPEMIAAVRRMQADYGIKPDGVIGDEALEILNLSDADRAQAIAVAMERIRWMERDAPATRIDVNIAAATLTYWRDGKIVDRRKVVVGKPETETPQLQSPIYRLVANPTWTVPRSIERREIAGKGAAYLRRNNMVRKDGWIVQQPGPQNSLGLVKFDMKNDHQIYLHDTPAKPLFEQIQRQRSHGCVRVADALGFAEILAREAGVLDQWTSARATGKESFVSLPNEIPVRLLYHTVLIDDAGEPIVRADPYGWNARVAEALGFPVKQPLRLRPSDTDVGP